MKICLINFFYPPNIIGGAEIYVYELSHILKNKGHEVVVIALGDEDSCIAIDEIKIYRIKPSIFYDRIHNKPKNKLLKLIGRIIDLWNPIVYNKVKNILKLEKVDIVHIHCLIGLSFSVISAIKKLNIPIVQTLHGYDYLCPWASFLHKTGELCVNGGGLPCKVYRFVNRIITSSIDKIIYPSKFIVNIHNRYNFFLNSTNNILVRNFVQKVSSSNKFKKNFDNVVKILYMGQISKHKGIYILLNAVDLLKEKLLNKFVLFIAGNIKDEIKNEFIQRIQNSKNIIKYLSFVKDKEKEKILEECDIFVLPSLWYDNNPISIIEAYANGIVVVASRIGGIPEIVEDGVTGYLVEPGNFKELAQKLEFLIENRESLREMQHNAILKANEFLADNHINRLIQIYKELIMGSK